jgi:DNA-binding MarR family transcriptional regulator
MKTRDILIGVIEHLSAFEAENINAENLTLTDFVGFLNSQVGLPELQHRRDSGEKEAWLVESGEETESTIGRLLVIMNRYAKGYLKKALEGSPIQTGEEFSYLIVLLTFESLTKTELNNKNIMEKTSGTEVIKRLIKLGFIEEFDDPEDKRSKRISITERGKSEIFRILPKMDSFAHLVVGNLNPQERATLAYLLKKLDHYHHEIYLNDRKSSFEELKEKYLGERGNPYSFFSQGD